MIKNMANIDKKSVRKILHDKLNLKKVYAKIVPKNLTQNQKDN